MPNLWELDHSLFRLLHIDGHRDWLDPVFWVISSSGLGWVQTLFILTFLPWQAIFRRRPIGFRRPDWRPLCPYLLALLVASLLNTTILKKLIPRDRPSNLADALPQEGFFHNSFPSGHTATSFALAATLIFATRGTPRAWIGWIALLWACLVGLSRIYRGVHWPTDVLGGALVGLGSASIVAMLLARDPADEPR